MIGHPQMASDRRPVGRWTVVKMAVIIVAALIISGCVQDNVVINVKPDGSGTIEETVLVGNSFMEIMNGLAEGLKEEKDKKPEGETAKEATDKMVAEMMEKAKKNAEEFGEGVRFVSAKAARTESANGYTAIFAFNDISKIKLNQNPSKKTPGEDKPKEAEAKEQPDNDMIRFSLTKGTPARLSVHMPPPKPKSKDDKETPKEKAQEGKDDANAIEMMKMIFKDMKVSIVLNMEGDIVNTNATYRSGRQITLIDMDFGKLIGDMALLKKINETQPGSIEEMKKMVKGIQGLKLEFNDPVIIDFK